VRYGRREARRPITIGCHGVALRLVGRWVVVVRHIVQVARAVVAGQGTMAPGHQGREHGVRLAQRDVTLNYRYRPVHSSGINQKQDISSANQWKTAE
jgi:hypothetical protein